MNILGSMAPDNSTLHIPKEEECWPHTCWGHIQFTVLLLVIELNLSTELCVQQGKKFAHNHRIHSSKQLKDSRKLFQKNLHKFAHRTCHFVDIMSIFMSTRNILTCQHNFLRISTKANATKQHANMGLLNLKQNRGKNYDKLRKCIVLCSLFSWRTSKFMDKFHQVGALYRCS